MSSNPGEADLAAHYREQARKRIVGRLSPRYRQTHSFSDEKISRFLTRNR